MHHQIKRNDYDEEMYLIGIGGLGLFGNHVLQDYYVDVALSGLEKQIFERLPLWMTKYGMMPYWMCFVLCLWMAMPRYRIDSGDRVRLVYLDEKGTAKHPPLLQ